MRFLRNVCAEKSQYVQLLLANQSTLLKDDNEAIKTAMDSSFERVLAGL